MAGIVLDLEGMLGFILGRCVVLGAGGFLMYDCERGKVGAGA